MSRRKKEPPDCLSCGACCVALHDQEVFCDVDEEDVARLPKGWVKKNVMFSRPIDRAFAAMLGPPAPHGAIKTEWKKQRAGDLKGFELCSCVALKGSVMSSVKCSVYEKRPDTCRTAVVPGDRTCLDVRRLFKDAIERERERK